jgi:zinc D-Ala-D-Ala carboxypeptidase
MTPLSPNFTLEEMTVSQTAERKGLSNKPTPKVLAELTKTAAQMEKVKAILDGKPVLVNSAYRSPVVNKAVGGVGTSAHCYGYAVDFIAPKFGTPLEICHALKNAGLAMDQVIEEGTWVHVSFDPRMRGQYLTMRKGKYTAGLRRL